MAIHTFITIFKIPELKRRILFTLAMLVFYRIGTHIPIHGINSEALSNLLIEKGGTFITFYDTFTGGAFSRLSIFALGIVPYFYSVIIICFIFFISGLSRDEKSNDEKFKEKLSRYIKYVAVIISIIQSYLFTIGIEDMQNGAFVQNIDWTFRLQTIITLTTGATLMIWLADQITERGIGNGILLIIFAGIVTKFPSDVISAIKLSHAYGYSFLFVIVLVTMSIAIAAAIVCIESGRRKIPVQYAKRVVGERKKVYGGQSTHIPIKMNISGVIIPMFISLVIVTLGIFIRILLHQDLPTMLTPQTTQYTLIYAGLIFFFSFIFAAIMFNHRDIAYNLREYGGYIPGIRPGQKTAEYLRRASSNLTFVGGIYLLLICILPNILSIILHLPFYFWGTYIFLIVWITLDTLSITFLLLGNIYFFNSMDYS